jgi:hypothetical protein
VACPWPFISAMLRKTWSGSPLRNNISRANQGRCKPMTTIQTGEIPIFGPPLLVKNTSPKLAPLKCLISHIHILACRNHLKHPQTLCFIGDEPKFQPSSEGNKNPSRGRRCAGSQRSAVLRTGSPGPVQAEDDGNMLTCLPTTVTFGTQIYQLKIGNS